MFCPIVQTRSLITMADRIKAPRCMAGLFLRPVRCMRAPPFLLPLLQINDDLSLLLVGVVAIVEVVVVLVAVAAISTACV